MDQLYAIVMLVIFIASIVGLVVSLKKEGLKALAILFGAIATTSGVMLIKFVWSLMKKD